MADVSAGPSQVAPRGAAWRTDVVAHGLGSFAIGSVLISAAFTAVKGSPAPLLPAVGFDILLVTPELLVLVAIGVALVRPLRRYAWLVAAAGTLGVAALFFQGTALERDQLFAALAISAGLQLGGVLLALADADGAGRWAIVVGFGAGGVAGTYGLSLLIRAAREGIFEGTAHGDDAMIALLGVLAAAAGLLLLVPTSARASASEPRARQASTQRVRLTGVGDSTADGSDADADGSAPKASLAAAVWVVGAAVVAVGLSWLWQLVLDDISQASTGGLSQERAQEVETMDHLARVAIGLIIGVIILVAALRRGGVRLARWVVVAFGLGATSAALPVALGTVADLVALFLLPAALGAFAGAALVRYADRWFPWDALGLVMIALVVLQVRTPATTEPVTIGDPLIVVGTFGLGLALTAGLARLTDASEKGLAPDDVSMSAALGFVALVLCQQVISPVPLLGRQDVEGPRLTIPLVMAGAAVLVVVLYWLGRRHVSGTDSADAAAEESHVG